MTTNASASDITEFLYHEAELLDDGRYREWLGLLTDDIRYQVPIRVAKERGAGETAITGVATTMFHLDEDRDSLELRVDRLETGFAWAEEPPSRIRHFVSNVRAEPIEGSANNEVAVRSSVLIYRSRWDRAEHDLLSCERHDVLRRVDSSWRLARRRVLLDNTTLPTLNLSFFI
jgi:ethylbenzene dioxygenase beta subunit